MKNLIRRITLGILILIIAGGGTTLFASRPIPTQHHVDSVPANHREAWRPTDTANFLDLAIALELFSNTHYSRGNLEGILFTAIEGRLGAARGSQVSVHDLPFSGAMLGVINYNPYFHQWLRQNQTELSQIAANFAFADITNPTYYTHALAPLVYFNVFGGRYNAAGERVFDGGANITRNESVVVIERLGALGNSREVFLDSYRGNVPEWALNAWAGTTFQIINHEMTDEQMRQVANGNLTRVEAAFLIARNLRLGINTEVHDVNLINSQSFRSQASARFSDLTNLGTSNFGADVIPPAMQSHQQRTGQLPMCPHDAWIILQMADLGIIMGFEDGTFRPFETIRRQDFAIMIMRALEAQANRDYHTLTGRAVN